MTIMVSTSEVQEERESIITMQEESTAIVMECKLIFTKPLT